jgi:hypothetical protein
LENLFEVITKAQKTGNSYGDFDFPKRNLPTFDCDVASSNFRELVLNNYLHQHVPELTRHGRYLGFGANIRCSYGIDN